MIQRLGDRFGVKEHRHRIVTRRPQRRGRDVGRVKLHAEVAIFARLGRADLEGLSVAVQGVGGVGYHLCRLLAAEGVKLRVADVRPAATQRARDEFG